jgi:hypothetical protein
MKLRRNILIWCGLPLFIGGYISLYFIFSAGDVIFFTGVALVVTLFIIAAFD